MYPDLIKYPIEHENLRWEAREALRDIHGKPRLFVRVKLTGTHFAARALIPQVWVGKTHARHVEIAEDGLSVRAYFDELPPRGTLFFGYGGRAELSFGGFDGSDVKRLDRSQLPREIGLRDSPHPPG